MPEALLDVLEVLAGGDHGGGIEQLGNAYREHLIDQEGLSRQQRMRAQNGATAAGPRVWPGRATQPSAPRMPARGATRARWALASSAGQATACGGACAEGPKLCLGTISGPG